MNNKNKCLMELTDLLKFSWVAVIPIFIKVAQVYYSSHFSGVKVRRDSLSLLNDVIGESISEIKPEKKLVLEETLSQYYKKNMGLPKNQWVKDIE